MRLIPKTNISDTLKSKIDFLVSADEHENDSGPIKNWFFKASEDHLLVIVIEEETQIGIIYHGGTIEAKDVGWWIASQYRRRGFGSQAIDLLAEFLKMQGVIGIGKITIDTYEGMYNEASRKLVIRLKEFFM